jgi:hypothetical protein
MCEICQLFASKYKCPRCMARTCSAACSKVHKTTQACSGQRDVTGFVRLKEFDDNRLMDDYAFLSGAKKALENQRVHGSVKAPPPQRRQKRGREEINADQPPKMQALARHCLAEHQTTVHLMPKSFTRRKQNKTHIKQGVVYWTVEVVVGDEKQLLHKVPDSDTVASLLARVALVEGVALLPVYGRPANDPLYFRIDDRNASLRDVLRGKEIVEFPTVLLRAEIDEKLVANSTEGATLREESRFVVPKLIVAELQDKLEEEEAATAAAAAACIDDDDDDDDDDLVPGDAASMWFGLK